MWADPSLWCGRVHGPTVQCCGRVHGSTVQCDVAMSMGPLYSVVAMSMGPLFSELWPCPWAHCSVSCGPVHGPTVQ